MALENQDTINNDAFKTKARRKQKKNSRHVKYYLSFMTLVLLALVFQVTYSALLNISKIVVYESKISKSEQLKRNAELKNRRLKYELENFNSMQKVESIARNNLKMAAENEVLVIINTPKDEEVKPKTKKEKVMEFFEKNIAKYFIQSDSQGPI